MVVTNLDANGALDPHSPFWAQLQAALNVLPAHAFYALPNGALTFLNARLADYLGLPKDHPQRFGTDTGADWNSNLAFLHPDDHEETRRVRSECLSTGCAGQVSFRVRNAEGGYRWFVSCSEPVRAGDGSLLYWIGVNLDIEELKQAEFYLAEGQRLARQAEAVIREQAAELRDVIDTIPAIAWSALPDGSNNYVNSRFTEYSGMSAEQTAGSGWHAVTHPDDLERHNAKWLACVASGEPFEDEVRFRRADGRYRWHLQRGIPLRDEAGNIVKWYGVLTDIEDRKRAEDKIREQEAELRQMLDFTPQLVAVFGPNRERLYVNRMALDYFGVTLDEWRETGPGAVVHPDDTERIQSQWDRAMSSGSAFEIEVRFRKSDGSYRWFLARYNSVRNGQGQILRWYAACTDIDDRRRDEERLRQENAALREEINQAPMFEEIVGSSEPLQKVLAQLSKVAPSDSTVLILGETGTGKELIARAIHKRSKRAAHPFIGVNCGAIPASLIASELFGHEKGAFTGATQRRLGRFEAANSGTIFLDEVGDLPPDIQIALLRVLQEREIERIGNDKPIPVDVRVLAATHCDLEKLVSEGKFRQDLLYRLNVVPLQMPSLRERAADIPSLVEYFIARFGKRAGKKFRSIDKKTLALLQAYRWPGNIRELQNLIERAVILSDSNIFAVDEAWLKREPSEVPQPMALNGVLQVHEKEVIEAALAQSHGRVSGPEGAAAKLGVPDSTLDAKIKRLGISKHRFKTA